MSDTATLFTPPAATPQAAGKTFDVDLALSYQVSGPTDFLFQIHALNAMDQQVLSESLVVTPALLVHVYADPTVHHRFARLHADAGIVELRYRARVQRVPVPANPAAQKLFGALPPGHARVQAIADWIHDHVEYKIGSSQATTTARDVFVNRAGVCRDFAHLGVTFCRALNIPARLVVGYARFDEPPPDFHAVFEAFIGGRWVMFDATRMSPLDELIRIAVGRDAKDVAFATIFGPATMLAMSPLIERVVS